jgi:hypothetical protein
MVFASTYLAQFVPFEKVAGNPILAKEHLWNFDSTSSDRIKQTKQDWSEGRFAGVPGETELILLPG